MPENALKTASPYPLLDMLRFGSALLVALGHLRGLYFAGIADVPNAGIFTKAFYLASSLQHEAVVIFFVLSGYLVGGPIWTRLAENSFRFHAYAIDRFARIYIVYLPSLALVFLVVWAGNEWFGATRYYAERPLQPQLINNEWVWSQVPCHLANVQSVFCRAWGNNPPLWSLGYEWTFYFLAPAMFALAFAIHRVAPVVPAAIAVLLLYAALRFYLWPLLYLDYWFAGTLAWVMMKRGGTPVILGCAAMALVAICLPVSRLDVLSERATDYTIALALAVALTTPALIRFSFLPSFMKWGADFSFSLYVLHLPLAIFIAGALTTLGFQDQRTPPSWEAAVGFGITLALTLFLSWLFARATEAHTDRARKYLKGLLLQR